MTIFLIILAALSLVGAIMLPSDWGETKLLLVLLAIMFFISGVSFLNGFAL